MSIRKNVVIGMIGANGTGKSVVTKQLIYDWKLSRPRQIVVGSDPHKQFGEKGELVDFYIKPDDKDWAYHIWKKCENSLIVLDDYKTLVPNYIPTNGMRQMFIDRRHSNNDFIYSCHSPGNVIDMLTDYTTHYFIFHTKSREGKFKDKMPNAELCIASSIAVNKYVSLYGPGVYDKSKSFLHQKFPYMRADTESQEMAAINMHNELKF